jgi:hypothetical protein
MVGIAVNVGLFMHYTIYGVLATSTQTGRKENKETETLHIVDNYVITLLLRIKVAARSKARTVFVRSNTGIMG